LYLGFMEYSVPWQLGWKKAGGRRIEWSRPPEPGREIGGPWALDAVVKRDPVSGFVLWNPNSREGLCFGKPAFARKGHA
jgi:hypothetical protein